MLKTPKYDIKVPVKLVQEKQALSGHEIFFRRIGPDTLEYRGGGGCLSVLGASFLLGGLLIVGITIPMAVSSLPYGAFFFSG